MDTTSTPIQNDSWDLRAVFKSVLKYWYLYLISFAVAIPIGKMYLKYVKPVYNMRTTILIKDNKNKQVDDILKEYKMDTDRNIYNEIEILKSFPLIRKTIAALDFDVSYFAKGTIREAEIYKESLYEVQLDTTFENPLNVPLYVTFEDDSNYTLSSERFGSFKGVFGEQLRNEFFSFTLYKTRFFKDGSIPNSPQFYFVINNSEELVNHYASNLNVEISNKNTSIIEISMNSSSYAKDIDFIKKLTDTYLNNELEYKNRVITNTIVFIDDLLIEISDSLRGAERQLEEFRKGEKIVDIESAALSVNEQIKELEKERAVLLVKDRYYRYLQNYITNNHDISQIVAPSLMGIEEPMLNHLVDELYQLNSDKALLGFNAKDKNPTYAMLDLKIKNAKKGLVENIRNVLVSSEILLDDNKSRLMQSKAIVGMLPGKERSLTKIKRKFNLNDNIYNYLLQKRTDASITKAANTADNMIVNTAYLTGKVSPNVSKINLMSVLLALLLPSAFVAFKIYFNNKIMSKVSIASQTNIPVIGAIEHYIGNAAYPLIESPRSSFSESVRSMRVNLKYLATKKKSKIIGITSTVSGEGKTFFALNLATSIALTDVKVLVIGADMRKPKLHKTIKLSNDIGLSTYLINAASADKIIFKTDIKNLDFIPAGPIPPNPIELIESEKMEGLIKQVSESYDYVIIDAAPIGLVADYYVLAKYTDANLYMVRYNYTKKSMLADLNKSYTDGKLKDVFIVYNDLDHGDIYGYGYGIYSSKSYGYFEKSNNEFTTQIKRFISKIGKKKEI